MTDYLKRFFAFALLLLCLQTALAQQAIQTPAQFLGYELGEQFTFHARVLDYVQYLAAQAPKRMRVQEYGRTYEGRPLVLAYIASDENLQRLEQIRENNLRQAGVLPGQVQENQPAILWLSYNVHGNEAVSSEVVLQVLYDLVNPHNAQAQAWLQNTVVLVDPCLNPDGRERYVQWYKQTQTVKGNPSPYAWEHTEPWPGGRPNHYYFDLNRDWAWQTQVESQRRVAVYNQWLPQVHADFHEMGAEAPYYFSPAAKPFHESITPWQREFQHTIGEYNRRYFDKNNWLYFTREKYDLLYPSYGDTWPTYNGAIGMTYEQGGSGRAGLAYSRQGGDTLTLKDRIAHHHAATLATLQATSERADQLKQEFRKYYNNNLKNPAGAYKAFVFKAAGNPGTLTALTAYLDRQQIRYGYAGKSSSAKGFNYATGKEETVKVAPQDLVISMYQPKSTLLKVLLEPSAALEDSLTYDITSWAMPYAFGLQAYALRSRLEPGSATAPATTAAAAPPTEKPYAYLASWRSVNDLQFLSALLQANIRVRVAERPFEQEGQAYAPGTLIITRTGNTASGEKFDATVRALAAAHQVQLVPAATGFVSSGADFGSGSVRAIKAPRVALLSGEGVSPYAAGEVWHFFEQQLGYPLTILPAAQFATVPFHAFDVLILPAGSYERLLSEQTLEALKNWIRGGGKLIALESAAGFLAGKKDFDLKKKEEEPAAKAKAKEQQQNPYELLRAYENREREALDEEVQGSIFRVNLDRTHPLAFGYGDTYYALVRSANAFAFLEGGWNVGVLKKNNYATGFVGAKAKARLQDALVLGTQELGCGQVIYLLDNPLFRGFWHSGKLLFGNAVFLVGQ